MKNIRNLCCITLLVLMAGGAHALAYIGGGAYSATANDRILGSRVNESDVNGMVFAGFRPIDLFALEMGYIQFGDRKTEDLLYEVEADAITAGGIFDANMGFIGLHFRGGFAYMENRTEDNTGKTIERDHSFDPFIGVGGGVYLSKAIYLFTEGVQYYSDVEIRTVGFGVRLEF